jgi:N-acetyl-anhydromuramyl-L-alanine amidase AmpD
VTGNDWWYVNGAGRYLWAGATDHPTPEQWDDDVSTDEMEHGARAASAIAAGVPAAIRIDRSFALEPKDYVAVATPKNLIVIHFTAGQSARSAFDTWRSDPRRIATAYIVDLDGTIYETFDPRYWASHLGIKGGPDHDKRSIGIEIANVGPLTRSDDKKSLTWWVGQAFCTLEQTTRYRQSPYRGHDYYAAFPDAQMTAVRGLVGYLQDRFSIAKELPPLARRDEFDDTFFASFRGVATHANFRKDKFDIGPAFSWDGLA